jgi:hypothetical protein
MPNGGSRIAAVWSDGTKLATMSVDGTGDLNTYPSLEYAAWTTVNAFSNNTTNGFTSSPINGAGAPVIWLRLSDNLTTRTVSWSNDGINFTTLSSNGHTQFLTPTTVGFGMNASSSTFGISATVFHWAITTP